MEHKSKKRLRCDDALRILVKGGRATFFTLTTPDVVEYPEIRARWARLRQYLLQDMRRRGLKPEYVMNFERHPGYLQKVVNKDTFEEFVIRSDGISHGWHIHGVISCRLDLRRYLGAIHAYGFGRVDVRPVTTTCVADYLTKHALKAYRGISKRERERNGVQRLRLVCTSRGMPPLSDYRAESPHLELSRYLMSLQVASVKHAGYKLSNAIALWKRAELAAMLYRTPFYESTPRSGADGRGGSRSLPHELKAEQSRRGCSAIRGSAKSEGRDRLAAPLGASPKIPPSKILQTAAAASTVSS